MLYTSCVCELNEAIKRSVAKSTERRCLLQTWPIKRKLVTSFALGWRRQSRVMATRTVNHSANG